MRPSFTTDNVVKLDELQADAIARAPSATPLATVQAILGDKDQRDESLIAKTIEDIVRLHTTAIVDLRHRLLYLERADISKPQRAPSNPDTEPTPPMHRGLLPPGIIAAAAYPFKRRLIKPVPSGLESPLHSEEIHPSVEDAKVSTGPERVAHATTQMSSLSLKGSVSNSDVWKSVEESEEYTLQLLANLKDGIKSPSIFLIRALRSSKQHCLLNTLCLLVVFFQIYLPVWFALNYLLRENTTFIAPGFHGKGSGPLRVRWLHNFALDVASAFTCGFISWSAWQRRYLPTFRFFLHSSYRQKNPIFYTSVLTVGAVSSTISLFGIVFLTYMINRIEPDIHELLLNAAALEFLINFDSAIVCAFSRQPKLRILLRKAKKELNTETDRMIHSGVLHEMKQLKLMSTCQLIRGRTLVAFMELFMRGLRRAYFAITFSILVLACTGGHIAHTHIRNVLWYAHIVSDKGPSESSETLSFLLVKDTQNPDAKYVLVAAVMITMVGVTLFSVSLLFSNCIIPLFRHCLSPDNAIIRALTTLATHCATQPDDTDDNAIDEQLPF